MNTHVVLRPFEGARPFRAGEEVDASGWRTARLLEERRYIKPLPVLVMSEPVKAKGNRIQQAAQIAREVNDGSQSTE